MLLYFVRQDLIQRFARNALGFGWALLAPLAQLALFALVFVHIFGARASGIEGVSYVAFISLGMWPWFAFSEAVARGMTACTDHAGLLGKVVVAPWQLVAARVVGAFLVHGVGFLLVLGALLLLGQPVNLLWLPLTLPAWAVLMGFSFASALLLAMANVFVRDLQQVVQYLLSASMFLAPILYSRERVPEALSQWIGLNPLTGFVEAIRDPLLTQTVPIGSALLALAITLATALIAVLVYRRVRPHLVDFL
jgi:lipopolysaccharide transport system permease protein